MERRGQRLGLLAAAAGAVGAAVVALVLVIGLQQEMASMRDELASRTTELSDLRAQVAVLDAQVRDAAPLADLEQRVSVLEAAPDVSRPEQDLIARRFTLVDAQGHELAVLGVDRAGFPELRLVRGSSPAHAAALALGWIEHGPALRVLDAAGNAPVFVGVTDQGPTLTLNAGVEGGAGASLQVDAQGGSTLALTDNDGLAQAALTLSPAAVTSTPSLSFSRWTVFGHERLFLGYDTNGPQVMLSNLKDAPRIRLGFTEGNRPSINVHDASATPRLEIFAADEIAGLRLSNATGQEHAALFSTQDGSALQLNDATQVRAALVGDPDGATLVLNDAQANPRTLLYFNEEAGSALDFLNEHGSNRAVFRTLDTGGALGFLDDQGAVRTTFAFADGEGVLAFFDEHETTRVSLTSSSDADALAFLDEQATERAVLASSPAGPALELRDAQGTIRAELGFGASGGPGLDLRDPQGALAATFSSSAAGRLLALYDGEDGRRLSLAINEGGAGLTIFDDPNTLRTHLGFLAEDLALLFMDENERARVIMGFDLNTLEPIFVTRDAEGNETWRSGTAAGP